MRVESEDVSWLVAKDWDIGVLEREAFDSDVVVLGMRYGKDEKAKTLETIYNQDGETRYLEPSENVSE